MRPPMSRLPASCGSFDGLAGVPIRCRGEGGRAVERAEPEVDTAMAQAAGRPGLRNVHVAHRINCAVVGRCAERDVEELHRSGDVSQLERSERDLETVDVRLRWCSTIDTSSTRGERKPMASNESHRRRITLKRRQRRAAGLSAAEQAANDRAGLQREMNRQLRYWTPRRIAAYALFALARGHRGQPCARPLGRRLAPAFDGLAGPLDWLSRRRVSRGDRVHHPGTEAARPSSIARSARRSSALRPEFLQAAPPPAPAVGIGSPTPG